MSKILEVLGRFVGRRPWATVFILVVTTGVFGVFAVQQQTDTNITSFAPDTDLARLFTRVQEDFAVSGGSAQVILDAGEGGNIISPDGVAAALAVQEVANSTPEVAGTLAEPTAQAPNVISFAIPIAGAAAAQGTEASALPGEAVSAIAKESFASEQGAVFGTLLSQDRDLSVPAARAALAVVRFDPEADDLEQAAAAVALRDALAKVDVPGVEIDVFSEGILFTEMQSGMENELPPLLAASFGLIVLILAFVYRSVSDVIIGLVGLGMTILWMQGAAVLMGPDYLGWVGPFTQISIIVPVLLIGMSIDYAIHLTSRYREERRAGEAPDEAARGSLASVGGALVLATVTTIIGFLTNVSSPLPPIADFGIFTAVGILAAFIIMGGWVPGIRVILDRRRHERGKTSRADEQSALSRFMGRAAVLSEHVPVTTLVIALVITGVATWGATNISTVFSQDDFIPADSSAGILIAKLTDLFGGDITEQTIVVVDGDLADPALAIAMLDAQSSLAGVKNVRSEGGRAQVSSAPTLVLQAAAGVRQGAAQVQTAQAEAAAAALAGTPPAPPSPEQIAQAEQVVSLDARFAELGVTAEGLAPDADMEGLYALTEEMIPGQLATVLSQDHQSGLISVGTSAGEDGATALAEAMDTAVEPIRVAGASAAIVSQQLVIAEILDALTASQVRSIIITLIASLLILVVYYGATERRPLLGVVTMIPSALVVAWTIGTIWALGMSFNVLTATVASIAIGIGVPYGIHMTHRYLEDRSRIDSIDEAIRSTVTHTGTAMFGAALTTAAGFGVLVFASLVPIQQFGLVTAITIIYSLVAAILVQPSCLVLWDRYTARRAART